MAATYMGQIVKGLEHLHDMGLAHHDMSLENLMVDDAKRSDRTLYAIICCLSVLFVILFFMVLE